MRGRGIIVRQQNALEALGPSFEELSEETMMNIDGELSPTFIYASYLGVTAVTGYAATCIIDRLK